MTQEDIYVSSDLVSADDIRDEQRFRDVTSDLSDEQLERLANTLKEAHKELMADSDEVLDELEEKLDEVDRIHAEAKELNETSSMVVNRLVALNVEHKVREMERNTE